MKGRVVVLTDTHKGCRLFREAELCDVLTDLNLRREDTLVFGGDLLHRPVEAHRNNSEFFNCVRSLSCSKVKVPGNHDRDREAFPRSDTEWNAGIAHLRPFARELGLTLVSEFEWVWNGKKCLVVHGDGFDRGINKRPLLLKGFSSINERLKRFDPDQLVSTWAKRIADRTPPFKRVRERALEFGRMRRTDVLIYGHHHTFGEEYSGRDLTVVNLGSWNTKSAGLAIFEEGGMELRKFPK